MHGKNDFLEVSKSLVIDLKIILLDYHKLYRKLKHHD